MNLRRWGAYIFRANKNYLSHGWVPHSCKGHVGGTWEKRTSSTSAGTRGSDVKHRSWPSAQHTGFCWENPPKEFFNCSGQLFFLAIRSDNIFEKSTFGRVLTFFIRGPNISPFIPGRSWDHDLPVLKYYITMMLQSWDKPHSFIPHHIRISRA